MRLLNGTRCSRPVFMRSARDRSRPPRPCRSQTTGRAARLGLNLRGRQDQKFETASVVDDAAQRPGPSLDGVPDFGMGKRRVVFAVLPVARFGAGPPLRAVRRVIRVRWPRAIAHRMTRH